MSSLRFRNVKADPSASPATWPTEAVQAALERGSLSDWVRMKAVIRQEPWGPLARRVENVLSFVQPYGVTVLMQRALASSRAHADTQARAEVSDRIDAALRRSGLSKTEFASRLGTSASRFSTYLSGAVTPSASILVRAEALADRASHRCGTNV